MFARPDLPRSVRALAECEIPNDLPILDLDDAGALKVLGLRPSQIVTRDRDVTQRWALSVYEQGNWSGLRWWSYYDPRWYSYAIWDVPALRSSGAVRGLSIEDPAVVEAATILRRPLRPR